MKGSEFIFDYFHYLHCKCRKMNPNRDGLYIDSLNCIKNKKATINHVNKKDNKRFEHTVTLALNHEVIKKDMQIIKKIKLNINISGRNRVSIKKRW